MSVISDINIFSLTGGLVRDAELKYTNAGTGICNFSLGFTRSIKKGDNWQAKSCYINCVIWGKKAEALNQYLLKGTQVSIEGQLDFDQWDDKTTGDKRSKHSIIVSNIKMHSKRNQEQNNNTNTTNNNNNNNSKPTEEFEDDIPF